jgi:hypothetical protein
LTGPIPKSHPGNPRWTCGAHLKEISTENSAAIPLKVDYPKPAIQNFQHFYKFKNNHPQLRSLLAHHKYQRPPQKPTNSNYSKIYKINGPNKSISGNQSILKESTGFLYKLKD